MLKKRRLMLLVGYDGGELYEVALNKNLEEEILPILGDPVLVRRRVSVIPDEPGEYKRQRPVFKDQDKDMVPKRLLSVQETAQYLGISPRTIYNSVHRRSKNKFPIKPKRVGKLVKFDIWDIDTYLDQLKELE